MRCEAEGKIIKLLGRRSGPLKNGKDYESMDLLLEEDNDIYHYKLRFTMTSFDGPIVDAPAVGDRVRVRFSVQARESKPRDGQQPQWFNSVNAISVEKLR